MTDSKELYTKYYYDNVLLRKQIKQLIKDKQDLIRRREEIETNQTGNFEERKKRLRSLASDIQRDFKCPVNTCQKQYGAEGSLNQHIKLKHPELIQK
ncbi:hypothetical protein pb186bvf_009468 [Paramecium bursaria]